MEIGLAAAITRTDHHVIALVELVQQRADVAGTVLERLDDPTTSADDGPLSEDDDEAVTGAIAIALDVNEADTPPADTPAA